MLTLDPFGRIGWPFLDLNDGISPKHRQFESAFPKKEMWTFYPKHTPQKRPSISLSKWRFTAYHLFKHSTFGPRDWIVYLFGWYLLVYLGCQSWTPSSRSFLTNLSTHKVRQHGMGRWRWRCLKRDVWRSHSWKGGLRVVCVFFWCGCCKTQAVSSYLRLLHLHISVLATRFTKAACFSPMQRRFCHRSTPTSSPSFSEEEAESDELLYSMVFNSHISRFERLIPRVFFRIS